MLLPKPIWRDVKGYEGHYQVNQLGEVRTLKYKNNRRGRLTPQKDKDGYLRIRLQKENKRKSYMLHRVVACEFIPNPNKYPVINHINENKEDNRIENLEWCTVEYNNNYGSRKGNFKKSCVVHGKTFKSQSEASKKLKVSRVTVDRWIKQGKGYYL